jgi:hypothetical protein
MEFEPNVRVIMRGVGQMRPAVNLSFLFRVLDCRNVGRAHLKRNGASARSSSASGP